MALTILPKLALLPLASCFGFLALSPALAQPNNSSNCKNPQTQLEMNVCAAQAAQVSDRRLNEVYRQVRAKYSQNSSQATQLVNAQLAWIKFRDQECAFSRNRFEGGSIAPLIYSTCIDRLTQQRTRDLETYLKEGSI